MITCSCPWDWQVDCLETDSLRWRDCYALTLTAEAAYHFYSASLPSLVVPWMQVQQAQALTMDSAQIQTHFSS